MIVDTDYFIVILILNRQSGKAVFTFLLVLIVIFSLTLIAGFMWGFIARGITARRTGSEVGDVPAEEINGNSPEQGRMQIPITGVASFSDKKFELEQDTENSYTELKKILSDKKFKRALPPMLMMTGVVGLTFFLGVTLLTRSSTLIGGVVLLAFSMYCAYLILTGFILKN
jgi:hypothetical protein